MKRKWIWAIDDQKKKKKRKRNWKKSFQLENKLNMKIVLVEDENQDELFSFVYQLEKRKKQRVTRWIFLLLGLRTFREKSSGNEIPSMMKNHSNFKFNFISKRKSMRILFVLFCFCQKENSIWWTKINDEKYLFVFHSRSVDQSIDSFQLGNHHTIDELFHTW